MDKKEYFQKYLDKLAFLEKEREAQNPLFDKLKGSPIPIFQEDIVKEALRQKEYDSLNYQSLLKAMVTVVALDKDFPYWGNYKKLFQELIDQVSPYLKEKRAEALIKEELDWAYIYSKGQYIISGEIEDLYYQSLVSEKIYNSLWKKKEADPQLLADLLGEIESNYQKILDKDPYHMGANERLAHIYMAKEQYVKARLYLEKALKSKGPTEDKESLREAMEEIENQANLEAAKSYLLYNRYVEALENLNKIKEKTFMPNIVLHNKGLAYYGLGDFSMAQELFEEALSYDRDSLEIRNDLAISLVHLKKEEEALENLNKAIEIDKESRISIYNRGIVYYNMGQIDKALEDFKRAYSLESDPGLLEWIEKLEESRRR